jgi:hypothetical protein
MATLHPHLWQNVAALLPCIQQHFTIISSCACCCSNGCKDDAQLPSRWHHSEIRAHEVTGTPNLQCHLQHKWEYVGGNYIGIAEDAS